MYKYCIGISYKKLTRVQKPLARISNLLLIAVSIFNHSPSIINFMKFIGNNILQWFWNTLRYPQLYKHRAQQ